MWRLRRYWAKLCNLFRHGAAEQDLTREIAAHLALMEEDFQQRGMSPVDAQAAARRAYGGIEQAKELHREARSFVWLEQALRDIQYAWRNLTRNPGFAVVVVLTLTLGIGVNATLFSAYNAVALKPLPVADPNEVVRLERWLEHGYRGEMQYAFSYPEYAYCRDHNHAFSSMVAASWPQITLVEAFGGAHGHQPRMAAAQFVSANYFNDLGVTLKLGRTFFSGKGSDIPGNTVAVISYPFWQGRFQGDPQIAGTAIEVNGIGLTIIGVAPEKFTGTSTLPQVPDLWISLSMQAQIMPGADWLHEPDNQRLQILGRLRAYTSVGRAESETASLIRQFASTFHPREKTLTTTLQRTAYFGNTDDVRFKALISALMLLVGSVLLVACVNVANMVLARGAARQREIGMRLALGASRCRIFRQLLTESIVLACLGGSGALLVALWATKLLWMSIVRVFTGLLPDSAVFSLDLSPDARVLTYTIAISLVTGVLFGLSPAMRFSRPDLTMAVRDEGSSLGWRQGRSRSRSLLVTTQVAVSMLLLISTGLLLRGLIRSQGADPGFETKRVLLVSGDFGSDAVKSVVLERQLVDRLQTQPAIKSVTLGTMPLLGTWTPPIVIERHAGSQMKTGNRTLASYASDTYFKTLGIPLLSGRGFTEREAANNAHVAVISESTARRFWPEQNPLGRLFKLDLEFRDEFTEFQVVGVAKDVRFANLTRIDPTHIYVPTGTKDFYGILVRTQGDSRTAVTSVRIAAQALDRNLPPGLWIRTIETGPLALQRSLAQTYATYAGLLASLTLVLAGVGIYGVMAYLVNRRVPEIGLRVALGATSGNVLRVIVVEGLWPAFVGMGAGIMGAGVLSWAIHATLAFPGAADLFYGIPFYDPITFLGLAAFFAIVTAIACFVPAKRAIGVDPVVALRHN